jgi:hypothetical protein
MMNDVEIDQPANWLVLSLLRRVIAKNANSRWKKAKRLFGWRGPPPLRQPVARVSAWVSPADPDCTERILQVGKMMPRDCRALVYGFPALVHPESCVIFGFALGTYYHLRLPLLLAEVAVTAGTVASETLFPEGLGNEWVMGKWLRQESEWCEEAYRHFEPIAM